MRKLILLLVMAGCTKSNPSATCTNGMCSDPNFPFCDVDGAIDGEANACIAVTCTPGDFGACDGSNERRVCNAADVGSTPRRATPGAARPATDAMGASRIRIAARRQASSTAEATARCRGRMRVDCHASIRRCRIAATSIRTICRGICDTPATTASLDLTSSAMIDADAQTTCNGSVITSTAASASSHRASATAGTTSRSSRIVTRSTALRADSIPTGGVAARETGRQSRLCGSTRNTAYWRSSPTRSDGTRHDRHRRQGTRVGPAAGRSSRVAGRTSSANGGGGVGFHTAGAAGR